MGAQAGLSGTYESMYQRAQFLIRTGDAGGAIDILQRISKRLAMLSEETLRRHEDIASFGYLAGVELSGLLADQGRYDEAVAVLRSLVRFRPEDDDEIEQHAARLLIAKGDLDEALASLSSLTERFPYDPAHWLAMADARLARAEYAEAEVAVRKALELAPDPRHQALIQQRLFVLHRQQGHLQQALEAWDRMAELAPDMAQHLAPELYTYLLDLGELDLLRRYLRRDPSELRAEYYRGVIDNREGAFASGSARWRRLLEKDPLEAAQGRVEWAEAALRTGRTEDALAVLSTSLQESYSSRVWLLLAIGLVRMGEIESARRTLNLGISQLRSSVPPRRRYDRSAWELLTSLTESREAVATLKELFDTGEEEPQ